MVLICIGSEVRLLEIFIYLRDTCIFGLEVVDLVSMNLARPQGVGVSIVLRALYVIILCCKYSKL